MLFANLLARFASELWWFAPNVCFGVMPFAVFALGLCRLLCEAAIWLSAANVCFLGSRLDMPIPEQSRLGEACTGRSEADGSPEDESIADESSCWL